ncbi:hypothetical protein GCM10022210_09020 [Mucilaginibacter dorajii]|uniref:DUF2975 domain-containing protein n=2 Tax=Mucilaginibacter dorajii TaxID=692994 RepID=A0ABP7PCR4_9SPHI
MVEAGTIMVSYAITAINPQIASKLYMGATLLPLMQFSFEYYTLTIAFMSALLIIKAYIAFLVIKVLSKIKMTSPFTMEISRLLEKVSYLIIVLWGVVMLSNAYTAWLQNKTEGPQGNLVSGEFIFLAGVVFVMAQIFKKGVEIQSENELTV